MVQALTFTAVFQASSLNYSEGMANISELKKLHRGNGDVYTFASRQSIRYDIVRLGNELFDWNLDTVDKAKGVIQFRKDVTIADSVEMDLFGYLKTDKVSKKRSAVARLSHAISLEPYKSDLEFLNNMGLAARIGESPNIANIEQHESLYGYTVTVDLNRIGVDEEVELPAQEKAQRVLQLLEVLKLLYRDIRGRRETLSPLFAVGGTYDVSNPFFMGRVQIREEPQGWGIDNEPLKAAMETTFMGEPIGNRTKIGLVNGIWANEDELRQLFSDHVMDIDGFFNYLADDVKNYYGV